MKRLGILLNPDVTGWLWGDNEKTAIIPGIGGGILFGGEEDKFRIGLDIHSLKGLGFLVLINM